jgi:hypothetical protein
MVSVLRNAFFFAFLRNGRPAARWNKSAMSMKSKFCKEEKLPN